MEEPVYRLAHAQPTGLRISAKILNAMHAGGNGKAQPTEILPRYAFAEPNRPSAKDRSLWDCNQERYGSGKDHEGSEPARWQPEVYIRAREFVNWDGRSYNLAIRVSQTVIKVPPGQPLF